MTKNQNRKEVERTMENIRPNGRKEGITERERPQLPEGVRINHVISVAPLRICDGPEVLGGISESKCSLQCAEPSYEDLSDLVENAKRLAQRMRENNQTRLH